MRMSSNQTHEPSTRESCRSHQAAATPSRLTTLDSLLLAQLPILLPPDSAQNCGEFIPHEMINQLSNALQHLTSTMQATYIILHLHQAMLDQLCHR